MIEKKDPDYVLTDKEPDRKPVEWVEKAFNAVVGKARPVKRAWNIKGKIKISEGPGFED